MSGRFYVQYIFIPIPLNQNSVIANTENVIITSRERLQIVVRPVRTFLQLRSDPVLNFFFQSFDPFSTTLCEKNLGHL